MLVCVCTLLKNKNKNSCVAKKMTDCSKTQKALCLTVDAFK